MSMLGSPYTYQRRGLLLVALLVVLVVALGWRAASVIGPRSIGSAVTPAGETASGRHFLVFMTSEVTDRKTGNTWIDDEVTYDFFRFGLDGVAVPERLFRIVRSDASLSEPSIRRLTDSILLLNRHDTKNAKISWIDVSGNEIDVPTDDQDVLSGVLSPDSSNIAYESSEERTVSILNLKDGLTKSYAASLWPLVWAPDSSEVYLTNTFEGFGYAPGLWKLDVAHDTLTEIPIVRELALKEIALSADTRTLVGVTFQCEKPGTCGIGPSALYVVDIATGKAKKLIEDQHDTYRFPRISPDGTRVAYTEDPDSQAETHVISVEIPSDDTRVISGKVVEWAPDGTRLVVDRDGALQIVDIGTGAITTVAQRHGTHSDPDFKGVEFIGIVHKR